MYWQKRDDSFNHAVTELMTKNKFEETKQYLHLANNSTLDKADKFAEVRPLFDANKQSQLNYKPTQHVSVDESMVSYFGMHGAKQYIHEKLIKFGYKLWVMASPLSYCIQFRPYAGEDSQLGKYVDIGLGASVVVHLAQFLPALDDDNSKYHLVKDNFFTSPGLLRYLREQSIAATETTQTCHMKNPPLKSVDKMSKMGRKFSDAAVQTSSNIATI